MEGGDENMYWVTGILGFVMMVAPFIFGYTTNPGALWTSLIAGAVVIGASYLEGVRNDRDNWEYWVAGIIGLFAIAAPFVLNFSYHAAATWTSIVVGVLMVLIAGSRLLTGGPTSAS